LRQAELAAGVLLTTTVIWLNFSAASFAGGLWRDEANTVGLATLPTLGDVWKNLQYDSFPLLWLLILREFSALFGPMNDTAFRVLGFCVAAAVVGALWYNARMFRHSVPLVSLAMVAMTPSIIVWGDTVRAYGFGIFLILVTFALVWRFVRDPAARGFAAATLAAIASVNVLFYNSVLLFAICAGAISVCAVNRDWRKAVLVVLIGALAAISIAPYAATIRDASSWNGLVRIPHYTGTWFLAKLDEALRPGGFWAIVGWLGAFLLAVTLGIRAVTSREKFALSVEQRDNALFSLVTLLVAVLGVFLFLNRLSYLTQPWYYISLLALSAVCMDALFGALIHTSAGRITRLVAVLLLAGVTVVPVRKAVRTRLTNVDLIASLFRQIGRPNDFVIVGEWYAGVSFDRYYRGPAPWTTVPPVSFHRFHRYDLLRDQMRIPDQTEPVRAVLDRMGEALRTGNRVFILGRVTFPPAGQPPQLLPPASKLTYAWQAIVYTEQWSAMTGYFLQQHAGKLGIVPVHAKQDVSRYENLRVLVAEGWRP